MVSRSTLVVILGIIFTVTLLLIDLHLTGRIENTFKQQEPVNVNPIPFNQDPTEHTPFRYVVEQEIEKVQEEDYECRAIFSINPGRSGSKFLATVFEALVNTLAFHENVNNGSHLDIDAKIHGLMVK